MRWDIAPLPQKLVAGIKWVVVTIPSWHVELAQNIMARVLGDAVTAGTDDNASAHFDSHATDLAACTPFNTSTAL
ncbi:hypothetical protein Alches_25730 [Alicyclobacillus hesperidum subsp. aegles]|uniref:hypothetical protein n=1 Tax=Alicyclobacillus hesperidum TaxID=89784 RepID=UPI001194A231|nr:hypothetical protein [Alicyclobacillus hesperidum]GEO27401.1 hypothetical protein AAC03nite_31860 [Alicyclobacillus acidoterrestris]GLG02532.1 hypothetical protein Alches_25730 [Alicyclobacillus hesperidum subsp. aegles]